MEGLEQQDTELNTVSSEYLSIMWTRHTERQCWHSMALWKWELAWAWIGVERAPQKRSWTRQFQDSVGQLPWAKSGSVSGSWMVLFLTEKKWNRTWGRLGKNSTSSELESSFNLTQQIMNHIPAVVSLETRWIGLWVLVKERNEGWTPGQPYHIWRQITHSRDK